MGIGKCFFSGVEAQITTLSNHVGVSIDSEDFGEYWITRHATSCYQGAHELSHREKMMCLQESLKLSSEGLIAFWTVNSDEGDIKNPRIVIRAISDFKDKEIDHKDKEKKILSLLSDNLSQELNPFTYTRLKKRDLYQIGIFEIAELVEWVNYLESESLIEIHPQATAAKKVLGDGSKFAHHIQNSDSFKITVSGWDFLRKMNSTWNSKNVFIAMAFTDHAGIELGPNIRDCIKTSLSKDGWNPLVVDEIHHNDGIMDKVLATIHESRFIIAELSYQKTGVYYEAGYAKGYGLPVIHIVNKDDLSKCHFDVKHLNLIVWESLDELSEKLSNRIKATIV